MLAYFTKTGDGEQNNGDGEPRNLGGGEEPIVSGAPAAKAFAPDGEMGRHVDDEQNDEQTEGHECTEVERAND